jgi:aspartokinase-like uncharacterized kinase
MLLTVAKVGGSVYDLPDLAVRLRTWLAATDRPVLFVPGGGTGADAIRRLDHVHDLGAEAAHWLALRVLSVNAHFLAHLLGSPVVPSMEPGTDPIRVLDPHEFCRADDGRPGSLAHTWAVTSDAIAARVAELAGADLALLKSTDLPGGVDWESAAATGLVDATFPSVVARARLRVDWVNLRARRWHPESLRPGDGPGPR